MKCIHCQGTMKKGFAPLHIDRKGCHLTLDSVPAWVCGQCGEAFFEEAEVSVVQELIAVIDQKVQPLAANALIYFRNVFKISLEPRTP